MLLWICSTFRGVFVGVLSVQGSAEVLTPFSGWQDHQNYKPSSERQTFTSRKKMNGSSFSFPAIQSGSGAVMVVWSLMTDMGEWLEGRDTDSGSIEPFISSLSTEWMVSPCMELLLYSRQGGWAPQWKKTASRRRGGWGPARWQGWGRGPSDCLPSVWCDSFTFSAESVSLILRFDSKFTHSCDQTAVLETLSL